MTGGESNFVMFGYETSGFTLQTSNNKVFGENVTIRNVDIKNNLKRLFRLGTRNAVGEFPNKFEGALSVEFDISDPWFLQGVLGGYTVSGTGPYTHTFSETNKPPSLTIVNGISGFIRTYGGAIIADCRITDAVGDDPAKGTLTIVYATDSLTSGNTTQIAPVDGVYPFSMGTLQYPTGSGVAQTESFELTITNNAALKWSLGSRIASRYDHRQRTYDITTTNFFDTPLDYVRKAYGGVGSTPAMSGGSLIISGEVGCSLMMDNGQVSAAQRKWIMTFTPAIIERHSMGVQAVEQEQMETIDIITNNGLIQVINNITTMP